ncbi:hypothetical protein HanRHA438_Chr05g0231641 [Helianthus annuus]|nr:hypothetical protein HanIR_Chr05g0239521 [Helianthus annuus]KAJ0919612.1 hypothetical protein HanRHA438_Chr05g0231641 [Helianthus annuus]
MIYYICVILRFFFSKIFIFRIMHICSISKKIKLRNKKMYYYTRLICNIKKRPCGRHSYDAYMQYIQKNRITK